MDDDGVQTVPEQWLNTQGLARYLHIHEKQVYALLKSGQLPGTKATGKWLFSKRLIDAWLEGQTRRNLADVRQRSRRSEGALLAAGSDDPLLTMLIAAAGRSVPGGAIFSAVTGSVEGLRALGEGYNTPQKLDRAIRCVYGCQDSEGGRKSWQVKCEKIMMGRSRPKSLWKL